MNRLYETMYIIRPDLAEPDLELLLNKYQTLLKEKQQPEDYITIQNRGKRRMEYKMQKHREGIYVQMNYSGSGDLVATLEKTMKIDDAILRFLTLSRGLDELLDNEKPPQVEPASALEVPDLIPEATPDPEIEQPG